MIFGKEQSFLEGRYSILSAFAKSAGPLSVVVCTDKPERFADLPVRVLHLTPQLDYAWRGEFQFLFRLKLCFLLAVMDDADKTILIDADTVLLQDPGVLFDRIGPNDTVMHDDEGPMRDSTSHWQSGQEVIDAVGNGRIDLGDGDSVVFDIGQHMWNAGIVGVTREHRKLIDNALRVTDVIDAASPWLFAEQFAFSVMLDGRTRLHNARDVIEHYWNKINYPGWHGGKPGRTLYHDQATAFFKAHAGEPFETMLAAMRRRPPTLYRINWVSQKWAAVLRRTIARQYSPQAAKAGKIAEAAAMAEASKRERAVRAARAQAAADAERGNGPGGTA